MAIIARGQDAAVGREALPAHALAFDPGKELLAARIRENHGQRTRALLMIGGRGARREAAAAVIRGRPIHLTMAHPSYVNLLLGDEVHGTKRFYSLGVVDSVPRLPGWSRR